MNWAETDVITVESEQKVFIGPKIMVEPEIHTVP